MSDNTIAHKYSFLEFIKEYKTEIPLIQRDYAQGRENKSKIRKKFLNALFEHLQSGKVLELDFIYGSEQNKTVQVLDGQQRLTTLFLLHWYIANQAGKIDVLKENIIVDNYVKFTYHTRVSSREFCQNLIEKGIDFNHLINNEENKEISTSIINNNWFYLFWQKDPTIKGMLTMLDDIHTKYKSLESNDSLKIWDNLENLKFYHLSLKGSNLTDSLYIKMNARGKKLTEFENFKAEFEAYINDKVWEKDHEPEKKFAHKIDTSWSDFFWKFRDDNDKIDHQLMRFMAAIAINYQAKQNTIYKDITEDSFKKLLNNPQELTPDFFNDQNAFNNLKQCFEVYEKHKEQLKADVPKNSLSLWSYYLSPQTIFKEFINEQGNYKKRVLFFALTEYLIKNKQASFKEESLTDWMRVTRNIVENSTIDSVATYTSAIKLIKELSDKSNSIYEGLNSLNIKSKFAEEQVKEEKTKAELIIKNNAWKDEIFEMEDHNFFKGQIGFAIKYANQNLEKFKEYSYKLQQLFGQEFKEKHNFLFQRALLATGYYLQPIGSNKTFCSFKDRISWRKAFEKKIDNGDFILKELLDNLNKDDIKKDLEKIINDFISNKDFDETDWRKLMIQYPNLIGYAQQRLVKFLNDKVDSLLYILSKSTVRSYHIELKTWDLYSRRFENQNISFVSSISYLQTTTWDKPGILLTFKNHKKIKIVKNDTGAEFDILAENDNKFKILEKNLFDELEKLSTSNSPS